MSQLDYEKVTVGLGKIEQALADSDMGEVSTHLLTLQRQLQGTPHLVDMLLPADIGTLVKAERARMTNDILADTGKKRTTRKPAAKRIPKLNIKNLDDQDLGDF